MSLYPVNTIQNCSNCGEQFTLSGNTLDVPINVKCDACNNPYFKGFQYTGFIDKGRNCND